MKFLFFFMTVCLAAGCCSLIVPGGRIQKIATKEILIKQKNLMRLLHNVHTTSLYLDQMTIAKMWRVEDHRDKFMKEDVIEEYLRLRKSDLWLRKGKVFTIANDIHRKGAIVLFHMLYFAKDWQTFYNTACWARKYLNEGMFVYSLTVAVLHRKDCKDIILPPLYEVNPFNFLNSDVITLASRIKMQGMIYDDKLAKIYGIRKVDKTIFITSNHTGWDVPINKEVKISYFMEDIGLNSYYFYFHADYPFWMGGEKYGLKRDRRGELFLYFHKQLLARYYMERLSNDLGEIPRFFWTKPIKTGFVSNLKTINGMVLPSRPNFVELKTVDNMWDLHRILDGEKLIRDVVNRGFVFTDTGAVLRLDKPEDIEILGNIIQGNKDSPNVRLFKYLGLISRMVMGNSLKIRDRMDTIPSVLEKYETALRDPMFYQIYQRYIHYANVFKKYLPFYRREEVDFMGVKIDDVKCDRLVTFFDLFDVDMTNAMDLNLDEIKTKKTDLLFIARQRRLNHEPFDVKIDLTSDKGGESIIRIFLGPKHDSMKHKIDIEHNRHNFFELDSFLYTLKVGRNTVVRNSRDFLITVKDRTMTRELFKRVDASLVDGSEFMLDMTEAHNGFPNRLILPKGKEMGMEFRLFVVVSPWKKPKIDVDSVKYDYRVSAGVGTGTRFWTGDAFGFPLDRRIVRSEFFTDNMFFKDVIIYHKSRRSMKIDYDFMTKGMTLNTDERDLIKREYEKKFITSDVMDKTLIDTDTLINVYDKY